MRAPVCLRVTARTIQTPEFIVNVPNCCSPSNSSAQSPGKHSGTRLPCVHSLACCAGLTAQAPDSKGLDNDTEGAGFQGRFLCLAKICGRRTPGHAHGKASSEATRRAALGVFPWQDIVTNSLSKPGWFCHPILSQTLQNTHSLQVNKKTPSCQQQAKNQNRIQGAK